MSFHVPENFRLREGPMATTLLDGNNGVFMLRPHLAAIASDGLGWEHVSVSRQERCPTWEEMCKVKALFWDEEDCVVQYHPPKSEYVNRHPYCLHLWRPTLERLPRPNPKLVG